ncbi:hypothetical protein [Streptomyces sp. NPDC058145]|uniref:hypothetical protein n=1 Tax=Streptomyces sp. NPDC058145 TaxID=3346356 RepID=UPI0036EC9621
MSTVGARTNATTLPIVLGLSLAFAVTAIDPLVLSLNLPQVSRSLHVPPQLLGLLTGAATLCMTAGIGAAAGPVLGGLITNYLGWRVSLLMEAVITLAVVLFMRRTVAPGRTRAHPGQRFDVLGALLSATGFGLLVVAWARWPPWGSRSRCAFPAPAVPGADRSAPVASGTVTVGRPVRRTSSCAAVAGPSSGPRAGAVSPRPPTGRAHDRGAGS